MGHNNRVIRDIETARRLVIQGLFVGLIVFVLFCALRGADFWNKIKGEGNLWNYGSSLQYFMAGQAAVLSGILVGYYLRLRGRPVLVMSWLPWAVIGMGFVFFACDEMLEIHETVGLQLEAAVPWLNHTYPGKADDLIVASYGLAGVLFVLLFFRRRLESRPAKRYFIAGFVSIGLAVLMDGVPRHLYINYLPLRESEELLEVLAGFLFTAAFISSGAFTLTGIMETLGGKLEVPMEIGGAIDSQR